MATSSPNRFIGRARESEALAAAWREGGVATVTGPCGVGKSRLARELARHRGAVLVPLADVGDASPARALAEALGLDDAQPAAVQRALAARQAPMVLFDDADLALDALAALLAGLRDAVPELAVAVTSRTLLRVPGERPLRVAPLPPDAAIALFEARYQEVDAEGLTEADATAVAELVTSVDRLPLAIELAAARAATVGVAPIARRLRQRLDAIDGGYRGGAPRSASVVDAIALSWEPLSPEVQEHWFSCALFAGPFALGDLERVAGAAALEGLATLRLHSVVRREPDGRFRMLDVLRRFALGRWEARFTPRALAHLRWAWRQGRHRAPEVAACLRGLAGQHLDEGGQLDAALGLTSLYAVRPGTVDVPGVLAAFGAAPRPPGAPLAAVLALGERFVDPAFPRASELEHFSPGDLPHTLARALEVSLVRRAYRGGLAFQRVVARAEELLGDASLDPTLRTVLHSVASSCKLLLRDHDGAEVHLRAAMAGSTGRETLRIATNLVFYLCEVGRFADAEAELRSVLADVTRRRDRAIEATARVYEGNIHRFRREAAAEVAYARAIALTEQLGDLSWRSVAMMDWAIFELDHGRVEPARARLEAALLPETLSPYTRCLVQGYLGVACAMAGDRAGAERAFAVAAEATEAHEAAAALAVHRAHLDLGAPFPAPPDTRGHVGWALRLLRRHREARHPAPGTLVLGGERAFVAGEAACIDLASAPGRILRALAEGDREEGLSHAALVAVGWPGERVQPKAGLNRLRVAVAKLRRAGFSSIETKSGGYRLPPSVPVSRALSG